jgi:hypothetical protein
VSCGEASDDPLLGGTVQGRPGPDGVTR